MRLITFPLALLALTAVAVSRRWRRTSSAEVADASADRQRGTRAVRAVLADRRVRDAQLSLAAARAIDLAQLVAVSALLFGRGGAAAVATFAAVRTLAPVVGVPLVTALGWRLGHGRLLALMGACAAVGSLAMAATVISGGSTATVLCAAAAVGIAIGCFRPVIGAALPNLARSPDELVASNAATGFLDGASTLLGPVLGSLVAAVCGVPALLAVTSAGAVAAGLLALQIPAAAQGAAPEGRRGRLADYTAGARELALVPAARLVTLMGVAQTFVRGALNVIVVVFAVEQVTSGDAGVGVLYGATGVGGLLGLPFAVVAIGRLGVHRSMAVGLAVWGAPLVVCGMVTSPAVAVLLFAVVGAGNGLIDVSYYSVMQRAIVGSSLARVLGVAEAVLQGGIAAGALVGALLVDHVGSPVAISTIGLVLPVVALTASRRLAALDGDLRRRDRTIDLLTRSPSFAGLPMSRLDDIADRTKAVTIATEHVVTLADDRSSRSRINRLPGNGWVTRLLDRGHQVARLELDQLTGRSRSAAECPNQPR